MSKYNKLWEYLLKQNQNIIVLSFEEIKQILGFEIDHSFLIYKKECQEYNPRISLKEKKITFIKCENGGKSV